VRRMPSTRYALSVHEEAAVTRAHVSLGRLLSQVRGAASLPSIAISAIEQVKFQEKWLRKFH